MTPEAQRIAIAETCGWKLRPSRAHGGFTVEYNGVIKSSFWAVEPTMESEFFRFPDYLNDLNAMQHVEKAMDNGAWWKYVEELTDICGAGLLCISATAAQRAEAFLKCLGLWQD